MGSKHNNLVEQDTHVLMMDDPDFERKFNEAIRPFIGQQLTFDDIDAILEEESSDTAPA